MKQNLIKLFHFICSPGLTNLTTSSQRFWINMQLVFIQDWFFEPWLYLWETIWTNLIVSLFSQLQTSLMICFHSLLICPLPDLFIIPTDSLIFLIARARDNADITLATGKYKHYQREDIFKITLHKYSWVEAMPENFRITSASTKLCLSQNLKWWLNPVFVKTSD